jgi:Tol biopolymer transport system component
MCVQPSGGALDCNSHGAGRPVFSADGGALYYAGDGGIHRRELPSGKDTLILADFDGRGGLALSPDGTSLVYSNCGAHTALVAIGAGGMTLLDDDDSASDPLIGPNGELAWLHHAASSVVLMVKTRDGRRLQLTDSTVGTITFASFSPDGRQIAFSTGSPAPGLYVVDADGSSGPRRVTDDAGDIHPIWFEPQRLAFTRYAGNRGTAYVIGLDGTGLTKIASGDHNVVAVDRATGEVLLSGTSWWDPKTGRIRPGPQIQEEITYLTISPDGGWLSIQGGTHGETVSRTRLPAATEPELVYTAPQTLSPVAIDNDGRVIASVETWSGDLYVVPAADGSRF